MSIVLDIIIMVFGYIGFLGIGLVVGVLINQKYLKDKVFSFLGVSYEDSKKDIF